MQTLKISKTDELYEQLALYYVDALNLTPESVLEHLKQHKYVVSCSRGRVAVDAITVANIIRGIRLVSRSISAPAPKQKTTAKKPKKVPEIVVNEDEIPF